MGPAPTITPLNLSYSMIYIALYLAAFLGMVWLGGRINAGLKRQEPPQEPPS